MSRSVVPARSSGLRRGAPFAVVAILASVSVALTTVVAAPASAAVVMSDDFEDGDSAGWVTSGGRWSVTTDGSRVLRQRGTSANARALTGDSSWSDYDVTARVKPIRFGHRGSVGLRARIRSATSYYYLQLRPNDTVELGKVVNGRRTALATASAAISRDAWHTVALSARGTTLVGRVGDVSVTATDGQLTAGRIGLSSAFASASFDDVKLDEGPDTQPPTVPGAPQILAVSPTTATITWAPSTDDRGVTGYDVYQGGQFYQRYLARRVTSNAPLELTLDPTAASTHFSVVARDAAGNQSQSSNRTPVSQPPSFPKTGDDTVPPSAPGRPVLGAAQPDGTYSLTWAPATDNVGVVEYHVVHIAILDEVRIDAKVATNSATFRMRGGYETVYVIAYDASWNATIGPGLSFSTPIPSPTAR